MVNEPFTVLQRSVDPMMAAINIDDSAYNDPLLNLIKTEEWTGQLPDQAGYVDLYRAVSMPAINIGDYYGYQEGTRNLKTGRLKFKKMTIAIKVSEDELERVESLGNASIIAEELTQQMKDNMVYMHSTVRQWFIDPFNGATTSDYYDADYNGCLKLSSTGTIANPSDMGTTAGSPDDLSAFYLTGAGKTVNNVEGIVDTIFKCMIKVDAVTNRMFHFKHFYMLVHPQVYGMLKANSDKLNATTGELSKRTYLEDFEARGITILECPEVSYTFASAATMEAILFADPAEWFTIKKVPKPNGEGWSAWKEIPHDEDNIVRFTYMKSKKIEFTVQPLCFVYHASSTSEAFFKPVLHLTLTPYHT